MTVRKLEHTGIMVGDLDASIQFYTQVIGMTLKDIVNHSNGVIRLAFLSFEGQESIELELIEGYNGQLPVEGKVHHLAFTVDDIESEFKRIQAIGIELIDQEIVTLPNGSRYFFFKGPEGEWLEMFQSTRN
ncbi:VOC family protein [Paenibacillus sp. ACRRX]|uniref:VOC family protein n=1 Tax=unclassified Paenibacillus TaxID=185978 RepID=UPI001EF5A673|nr:MULTISPECIES: VOC family protein [unclassified Paenibacillus]MCG7409927.1 VOC family protein [Paenibacillus sp. ACRRX]MDK8183007.1 VOC family protein [Paenibacillus sp. UMB4589-SE434]